MYLSLSLICIFLMNARKKNKAKIFITNMRRVEEGWVGGIKNESMVYIFHLDHWLFISQVTLKQSWSLAGLAERVVKLDR